MALLDVINVGQGDCIVINPPQECDFSDMCIMIDTGDGSRNITKCIGDRKVCLFITHHDKDHFGGFKYFVGDKWNNLEKVVLPFYQNELTLIAKAMLNLKGISKAVDCEQFIDYFDDIVNNQMYLKSIFEEQEFVSHNFRLGSKQIELCREGDRFCNHIECLNPPCYIYDSHCYDDDKNTEKNIDEIFNRDFAKEMKMYFSACRNGYYYTDSILINNLFLYLSDKEELQGNELQSNNTKSHLFFNFITTNLQTIRAFNANPTRENYRAIFNTYKQTSHDVCLVLKIEYSRNSFLLTGDASKKVFYRLIDKEKNISANYLKVPHPGSKHNLSEEIIKKIDPKTAIISHNNRRFGKSSDTHPNWEVLYLLQKHNIQLITTNDVVKDDNVVIEKCNNIGNKYVAVKDIF